MSKIRAVINTLGALFVAFVLTTCVVAAFACGTQEPETYSVTGSWLGGTTYGPDSSAVPVTFTFNLVDRQGEIKGGGTLAFSAEESYTIGVEGIRDQQAVSLGLLIGHYYRVDAQGRVTETTLTLTLSGSGFRGERLMMERQEVP